MLIGQKVEWYSVSKAALLCCVPESWLRDMVRDGHVESKEVAVIGTCIHNSQFDAIKALHEEGATPAPKPQPKPEPPPSRDAELLTLEDASRVVGAPLGRFISNGAYSDQPGRVIRFKLDG